MSLFSFLFFCFLFIWFSQESEIFPGKEEMELSLQKFNNEIKEIRCERDKALQQLARLKQHLLEKVACSLQIFSHSLSPPFFCFFFRISFA